MNPGVSKLDKLWKADPLPETFREYVSRVRPRYRWFKHCEKLAEVLQKVADGKIKRLMVFMPPRHGKSEEVSRLFSAYFLHRYPHRWVSINSYAAELAYTLSRAARENYKAGGGKCKSDADAVKHWETVEGGGLFAAGVGGPITGKGWHLGIIDDPLKNAQDAASETIRESQKEWYQSTFLTREEPNDDGDPDGALIVILTRWNQDDLAGWQLALEADDDTDESEKWHIVSWPAIKEEDDEPFPASCTVEPDWRQHGEALCPERRPVSKLRRIMRRVGDYFWNALYQQRPRPKSGLFFNVDKLEVVDKAPDIVRACRGWDQAATEGAGDYTAGVKIGACKDGGWIILDMQRGQWGTSKRNERIVETAHRDGKAVRIRGAQDPGNAGVDAAKAFCKMLQGFTVKTERASGSKETRADPFSAQVNAGNVKMLKGPWNHALREELRSFPNGTNDDIVDAASDSFNDLAEMYSLQTDDETYQSIWGDEQQTDEGSFWGNQ